MLLGIAKSKNNVKIRLTDERWLHITMSHKEIEVLDFSLILEIVEKPDLVLKGYKDELLAVKKKSGKTEWIVVAYKESDTTDGFILTAYLTTNDRWLFKRKEVWSKT